MVKRAPSSEPRRSTEGGSPAPAPRWPGDGWHALRSIAPALRRGHDRRLADIHAAHPFDDRFHLRLPTGDRCADEHGNTLLCSCRRRRPSRRREPGQESGTRSLAPGGEIQAYDTVRGNVAAHSPRAISPPRIRVLTTVRPRLAPLHTSLHAIHAFLTTRPHKMRTRTDDARLARTWINRSRELLRACRLWPSIIRGGSQWTYVC
jgi:hypothetical protein